MSSAIFIIPEVAIAGWFLLNRWSAAKTAKKYGNDYAMLQALREFWREGDNCNSRAALLALTQKESARAFKCEHQGFFLPHRDGSWSYGDTTIPAEDSALLTAIVEFGQPVDAREHKQAIPPELKASIDSLMQRSGINVMVPVSDSSSPQWVWVSSLTGEHTELELDSLRAWQMAMQSVVERDTLLLASAHLEGLEKDAASATEVLRVLLPGNPHEQELGMEWAGALERQSGEPPLLFATYPQESGKILIVFAEVVAPGLAAVIMGSALRGYCDSLVSASKGVTLSPESVLKSLNDYIWRPKRPSNISCVVALFDTAANCVDYAAAGAPCWLHVSEDADMIPVQPTGPGLGAGQNLDYKCERIALKGGDTHLFIGSHLGVQAFSHPALEQQVRTNKYVSFADLEQHVQGLTETLFELAGNKGPTPGVVTLRPAT